jgi:EAL domain-containing protein (putative c-di-GMP-specific phosphodiesterase class I)/CHASE2 domain-containing sensor protein
VPGLALLAGWLVLVAGWGIGLDRGLREFRDGVRMHSASGEIVIVEVDARSLRALDQWPWPRRHHAALVDRLAGAGAALIAFDVNFEVASNSVDDAAFADALKRAGGLVALPTFRQNEDSRSSRTLETIPYNMFLEHVFLAGVNIDLDDDGLVRRLPLGTFTSDTARPSMASLLAEAPGAVDDILEIDFSIDPATIPRLSFVEVIEGRVDPSRIAGKRLFVGGTAADMEDRYAVPIHGVLPGVVVQTLAAETLLAGGAPFPVSGWWLLLLALVTAAIATRPGSGKGTTIAALGLGLLLVLALPLATEHFLRLTFPVAPALATLLFAAIGALALQVSHEHQRRSLIDAETGLPNLKSLLAASSAEANNPIVVTRIDRFDEVAATLGPAATAMLVQRVAERIAGETGGTIYRTDDNSLAWVAPAKGEQLESQLRSVSASMRLPIECGRKVDVTVGLGVAESASGGREARQQQIANAAFAAERALRDRRPYLHFAEARDDESGWHLSLMSELDSAMEAGEVWNAYQPKLDIRTGRICGVETLVRWSHRERGPVGPDRFIPVVEANGRAADLTAHVFREALADAARWHAIGHRISVAVNVSATLLEDKSFILWLSEALRVSTVDPATITVEVTESAAVKNVEQAAAALREWRALGVAISIDDYGTGQSSLGYLQRLPASELKIDKSFIENVAHDARDAIMVRSTVALAHQLGMKVVAEGIENEATLAALRELDCDVAQGWLIGKPMPAAALESFLAEPRPLAA